MMGTGVTVGGIGVKVGLDSGVRPIVAVGGIGVKLRSGVAVITLVGVRLAVSVGESVIVGVIVTARVGLNARVGVRVTSLVGVVLSVPLIGVEVVPSTGKPPPATRKRLGA